LGDPAPVVGTTSVQQSDPEQVIDRGLASERGWGSVPAVQAVPFHWKETDVPVESSPITQQLEDDPQATAFRPVVETGSVTVDHVVPFHWRRIPGTRTPPVFAAGPGPTAKHADDDVQVTESSPAAVGVDVDDHDVPFHPTTNACGDGLCVLELSVPTAQQSEALVQVTAPREVPSYGDVAPGTDPTDHEVPFHWRTKSCGVLDCQVPTIQQSLVSAQVMAGVPSNWMVPPAGLGVVTCVQDEPFQLSVRTCWPAVGLSTFDSPTVQQFVLETQVTEVSIELETPRLGNDDCDHQVPFQLRMTAVVALEVDDVSPTAQQSLLATQVTEYGSTDTLGANMFPREANAQPGPDDELVKARCPSCCTE